MRARSGSRASRASWVLALALTLGACPRSTPPVAPSPAAPKGIARVAVPDEPATLNPLIIPGLSAATQHLLPLVVPVISSDGSKPGHAAAEITAEVGGSRPAWRITVKPGAHWSDGTAITAADIVRTWGLVRDSKVPFSAYSTVTDARMEGATAIVAIKPAGGLHFDRGYPVLPPDFEASNYSNAWPVSGGPFELKAWNKGLGLEFRANLTAPGGPPKLEGLFVSFVPDPEAALALFERNEIDVLTRYGAPAWRERLVKAGAVESDAGAGRTVALVMRAPATTAARERMLARIDLARINDVLVQKEAALRCDGKAAWPQCYRGDLPDAGPRVGPLTLAYLSSDTLAATVAAALRLMLGPLRLQPRSAADLATHVGDIDLMLLTAPGRDDLAGLEALSAGPDPSIFPLFVAAETLGASVKLERPGIAGPFEGAGRWPSSPARP